MSDHSDAEPNEAEIDRLEAELGLLARELTAPDVDLLTPPADLWAAIEADAFATPTYPPPQPAVTQRPAPTPPPAPLIGQGLDRAAENPTVTPLPTAAPSLSAETRGLRPEMLALAAAVALLLAAGAFLLGRTRSAAVDGDLVAQATIVNDGLPVTFDQSGTAEVRRNGSDLFLDLQLPELPSTVNENAYYEVWMIDTDVEGMVSLGVVNPDGRVDLPDDIDPAAFPVVDISVEPLDGNPTHSGQSILRGVLSESGEA